MKIVLLFIKDIENDFELKNNVYDDIHHDFY